MIAHIINHMKQKLTAIVYKDEDMYVAECLEIDVASQGKTKEEAMKNLKEATELYLEVCPIKKFKKFVAPFEVSFDAKTAKSVRA